MTRLFRPEKLALGALLLLAFVLAAHNLAYHPQSWFDEGWYLQIPKNLVQYGEYATRSSEGFRAYDPVVGVSPALYLPIAAVFKIAGIGLVQGRAVVVVFFLLSCLLLYRVTHRLFGSMSALIALALFILVDEPDWSSPVLLGRQVMAEIPATCFLLAAIYYWIESFERRTVFLLILAGTLFGVAMTTKSQWALVLLPAMVVIALLDRLFFRTRPLRFHLIPFAVSIGVITLHYLLLFLLLGSSGFSSYLSEIAGASGPQVRVFLSPSAMRTAFSYPLRSRYSPWMVAGLAYFVLCARKKPDRLKQWFPWILAVGWWTWFLFLSVGWTRYAFPALVASHIFVAKFVRDLVGFSELSLSKLRSVIATDDRASVALRVSVVLMFAVFLLVSSSQSMKQIFLEPSQSAQQFAAYLQAHVEKDELVETWEWEVAFLADGVRFHHPPSSLLPILLAHHWFGAPYDPQEYDFQQYSPSYIVVGWFAKTVQNLYPVDFLEKEATLVASIGIYDLYSLNVASEVTR